MAIRQWLSRHDLRDYAPGLIGAAIALAFVPAIRSYASAPKWSVAATGVALALCFAGRLRLTVANGIGLAILGYAMLSIFWSPIWQDGLSGMAWLLIMAGAFCLGEQCRNLDLTYRLIGFALLPTFAVMALTRAGVMLPGGDHLSLIGGLFGNRNFAAEFAGPLVIGLVDFNLSAVALACSAMAVVAIANCRGAMVGLAAAAWIAIIRQSLSAAIIVGMIALFALPPLVISKPTSDDQRAAIWRDTIDGLSLFGHGIGSYRGTLPRYGFRLPNRGQNTEHAHNDFLELSFELGIGALAFVAIAFLALSGPGRLRDKLVLVAFLVEGLFGFPAFEPGAGVLFAIVAGHLVGAGGRLRHGADDVAMAGSTG